MRENYFKDGEYWVSPYNFVPEVRQSFENGWIVGHWQSLQWRIGTHALCTDTLKIGRFRYAELPKLRLLQSIKSHTPAFPSQPPRPV